MTKQEIFDKVVAHLLAQGQTSLDEEATCMYRGDGGLMCAVGCLIPDELYDPEMEGVRVRESPKVLGALANTGIDTQDEYTMSLLDDLQQTHDSTPPRHWERALANLAAFHGLNFDSDRD